MKKNTVRYMVPFVLLALLAASCRTGTQNLTKAINPADMDQTVDPTVDFYTYVNGGWKTNHPIPEDKSRFGTFDLLIQENNEKLKELVNKLAKENHETGSIPEKIGLLYSLGMDSTTIEEQRLEPLMDLLGQVESIQDQEEIQAMVASFHAMGIGSMFAFGSDTDPDNSKMAISRLVQGGLGMADRDYYTDPSPRSSEIRSAYLQHLTHMFELLGDEEEVAAANAQTVMEMETGLAEHSMTRLERRDPYKTKNKMGEEELGMLCEQFDWGAYFESIGVEEPGIINVGQPSFFRELNEMLSGLSVDQWKTYLRWHLVHSTANYLSSDFVDEHFEFYGKVMQGTEAQRPRWERVLAVVNRSMGEALGQMYVEEYFPPRAKEEMLTLVGNLRETLELRIQELEWMGDSTKQRALEKLAAINVKIGYPDKWRDFSGLEIMGDSYVENVLRAREFDNVYDLDKIGKPVDPQEWGMTPQTVNAYYSPDRNEIVFPAGILQPPFFYLDADDAVNYGAIGVVIGHEITHGFDDRGRQWDKDGNLKDWWTETDAARFEVRARVLEEQFNQFPVLDTVHADGKLTLGENIADLGGLNIAFNAYKLATQRTEQVAIDGFSPDQRFFLAYGHLWAQNIRDAEKLRRTKLDPHSLGTYRVIGPLKNMPEFHSAFDIQPGDPMYLAENERAIIW